MTDELWTFNGLDASTGDYLLELDPAALTRAALGETLDPRALAELKHRRERAASHDFGVKEGVDVRELAQTGWGVVFPAAAPDGEATREQAAILEALRPLLEHRKAQATREHAHYYKQYTGASGYQPGESKQKFLARHGAGPGPADPEKVPYYLLLVGDPRAIPFRLQSQLSVQYAVGRLWFPSLEEYAHYARSVVTAETGGLRLPRRLALFGAENPDDPATRASGAQLVTPLADILGSDPLVAGWSVERTLGEAATRQALSDLLHRDAPALLFTASHGVGFPAGDPLQLRHQGALLCQDWPGPRAWRRPIPERFYLAGEHLAPDLDLLGSVAFLFACYGAGTPEHDEFSHASDGPRPTIAPHPFVAGLPTAMLGRGGALAVVGHVERAWGHSFLWAGTGERGKAGRQVGVFESALKSLMRGMPVGAAMEVFDERYAELATDLSATLEDLRNLTEVPEVEVASLWTAHNDARGYAILGDPAVRVMVGDGAPTGRPPRTSTPETSTRPEEPQGPPQGPPPPPLPPRVRARQRLAEARPDRKPAAPASRTLPAEPAEEFDGPTNFGMVDRLFGREEAEPAAGAESDGVMGSLRGFVDKLGQTISGALTDMSNLEVRTYVTDNMAEFFVDEGTMHGAELRAYTRISLDGDTIVCVPERDGEVDKAVFDIHAGMVRQAQEARMELLKAIVQAAASLTGLKR